MPTASMNLSTVIKEIGRGARGARALSQETARATMAEVLAGTVDELQLGALLIAFRMKGETLPEITGFLQAVHERCAMLQSSTPVVLIPSYNGARRLCNLTPLLATLLAREGMPVLVHGPMEDPTRVSSAAIFRLLGLTCLDHGGNRDSNGRQDPWEPVYNAWSRREPAFVSTASLCPELQTLLNRRWQLGVRNAGHTVAKMIQPVTGSRALRLMNFTHPEFGALMQRWAQQERADTMLLRGTEGEPVADPRRLPRIDSWIAGQPFAAASCAAQDGVLAELPTLPNNNDAASTAQYVQAVLGGESPVPAPLLRQVALVRAAHVTLQTAPMIPERPHPEIDP